jgi:hypothetical protein
MGMLVIVLWMHLVDETCGTRADAVIGAIETSEVAASPIINFLIPVEPNPLGENDTVELLMFGFVAGAQRLSFDPADNANDPLHLFISCMADAAGARNLDLMDAQVRERLNTRGLDSATSSREI